LSISEIHRKYQFLIDFVRNQNLFKNCRNFQIGGGIILSLKLMAKNNAIKNNETYNNIFGQNLSNDRQAITRHRRFIFINNSIINN
jgi:hypothetical protein